MFGKMLNGIKRNEKDYNWSNVANKIIFLSSMNKFRIKYQVNIYTIMNIYYFNTKFHSEL